MCATALSYMPRSSHLMMDKIQGELTTLSKVTELRSGTWAFSPLFDADKFTQHKAGVTNAIRESRGAGLDHFQELGKFGGIRPRSFVGKADRREVVTACLGTIVAKT